MTQIPFFSCALMAVMYLLGHVALAEPTPPVSADGAVSLDAITVTGQGSQDDRDLVQAYKRLEKTPGNVSIIRPEEYGQGATLGLGDALSRLPGVLTESHSGQESTRISIRGSGLSTGATRGVSMLRDGLPLGRIDDLGDSIYADPSVADYIEVYRGANALQFGSATLGGAINLVSPTGLSQPGTRIRMEAGSYGHAKGALSVGQAFDNGMDFYASASGMHASGARAHSQESISRFYGNIGLRFSAASQGRLSLTSERYEIEVPGALTLAQLMDDASQANSLALRADGRIRTHPRTLVSYQHELALNSANRLSVGVFYGSTHFVSPGQTFTTRYDAQDYGVSLRQTIDSVIGGHENRFVWGAAYRRGSGNNGAYWPDNMPSSPYLPHPGQQLVEIRGTRSSQEIFAENVYALTPTFALVTGVQTTWADRDTDNIVNPFASRFYIAGSGGRRYVGLSPKLGVIWDAAPRVQVFANIAGSFEPPNNLSFYTEGGALDAQRATTLEAGTRGGDAVFGWDAAVYYSWVRQELLLAPVRGNPAFPPQASNADDTRHVGLELGLHGQAHWSQLRGAVDWRVAYTWSQFRFHRDMDYGNNVLPGVPPHSLKLEAIYRHPSGWYAGPAIELSSAWQVDQANTLQAPGHGVVNFSLGYAPTGKHYRWYADARNLGDVAYVSTTDYTLNARGVDVPVFYPGLRRSVFVGVELDF